MNQIYLAMAIPGYSLMQIQQIMYQDYQRKLLRMWGVL